MKSKIIEVLVGIAAACLVLVVVSLIIVVVTRNLIGE